MISGEGLRIIGWGNGDPGFKYVERPVAGDNFIEIYPFANKAQVIVRSVEDGNSQTVKILSQVRGQSILLKAEPVL